MNATVSTQIGAPEAEKITEAARNTLSALLPAVGFQLLIYRPQICLASRPAVICQVDRELVS